MPPDDAQDAPAADPTPSTALPDTPFGVDLGGVDDVVGPAVRRLTASLERVREDLERLVRIPSVSAPGHDPDQLRASADATAEVLEAAGLDDVRLLEVEGAPPYVTGEWLHAPDAPTVLLYAHHDVQPIGTPDGWNSDPFEPTERPGPGADGAEPRLYGRGAADDKAGIMVHVAAVDAWLGSRGELPCNVRVIIEGEEEIGSPHLDAFLEAHADELRSDVIVLTDLTNWKVGWPALTTTLRGMGECFVTVRALDQPVHSGMYGGPVPDALTGMIRLLATLHDDDGRIAVPGFADGVREPTAEERRRLEALDEDPGALREEAGMRDPVRFVGEADRGLLERIWLRPTITPTGLDVPDVAHASNTLLAEVGAKLSCRFAPGQDPDAALRRLAEHLRENAPWGLEVEVELGTRNAAWSTPSGGPAWDAAVAAMTTAYGRAPAELGCGGSIPFVEPFSEAFAGDGSSVSSGAVPCLLTGIEDPYTNAHGEDESLHLGDFRRACLAETLLFHELARRWPA